MYDEIIISFDNFHAPAYGWVRVQFYSHLEILMFGLYFISAKRGDSSGVPSEADVAITWLGNFEDRDVAYFVGGRRHYFLT